MAEPQGLAKPRRIAFLVPIAILAVIVLGAAVFAWSHFIAKGPGQDAFQDIQDEELQADPIRGPYNAQDFTEPDSK